MRLIVYYYARKVGIDCPKQDLGRNIKTVPKSNGRLPGVMFKEAVGVCSLFVPIHLCHQPVRWLAYRH